jgi:iron complex transport system ATP-binding protein
MMEIRDISVGYLPGKPLLRGVNLKARKGEMVALVGMNGSGKSTLLRSILGLLPILEGKCLLDGTSLADYDPRSRAQMLSYVSPGLRDPVSLKVRELVALGRLPHSGWMGKLQPSDHAFVERVLAESHLSELAQRPVDELSDGERQRVVIARAVVQDTPVMILDEPGAYLDIPHRHQLLRMLAMYRDRGKTVIFSTHDLELAVEYADKFWVISKGVIHEGAPEDLGIEGLFNALFRDSGLSFDLGKGRFLGEKQYGGSFQLEGQEEHMLSWTAHALERLGFKASQASHSNKDIQIRIRVTGGSPFWEVSRQGKKKEFDCIYDLARFLTEEG